MSSTPPHPTHTDTSHSAERHTSDIRSLRQQRLLEALDRHGLDAFVLNPGPSLTYLTGLHFHLSERPVLAIFRPEGAPVLVVPELEAGKLGDLGFETRTHTYGEDPTTWPRAFQHAAEEARLDHRRVGVEPGHLRVLELRMIEEAAPRAGYLDGEEVLFELRARKDDGEIDHMRRAVRVAEEAMTRVLETVRPGVTEKELAAELTAALLRGGSAPELPFSPIVAFGESAANPHAVPSDRALAEGDLILCDWGASHGGYCSDLTRMFSYGNADPELREIVDVVAAANDAARHAAGPGVAAMDVDRAARGVIEKAGFGRYFVHRTGHGLGLEAHEPPYLRGDSENLLEPGMTFTVEPGIYLPGRGGARIEDDVVVTENGAESLTSMERSLVDVAGTSR